MEILTLPMREGILYLPCPSGIGIEILTLSVRVSIGMFSAHIKEYDYSFPVSQGKYDYSFPVSQGKYDYSLPVGEGKYEYTDQVKSALVQVWKFLYSLSLIGALGVVAAFY